MKSLNELLLDAPRLGDRYGVNLRARLTDERLDELFDGAEFTGDELKLLRVLGACITADRLHTEDYEWWKLLMLHLPRPPVSLMLPTLHKVTSPQYVIADLGELRSMAPSFIRFMIYKGRGPGLE